MKKEVSQIKIGSILSYLQIALNIIIGFAYTPIMIRLLGQSEYGLYNTVSSTISMLSILNLGFGSGYIRYYAKYKKENDNESIYKLNGLFLIIFSIIGAVALACGLFLTFNLQLVFDTGLTAAEYETAKILMLMLAINMAISFPASVFANMVSAHEKFIFLKLFGMVRTVIGPLVTLPLLFLGYGSIAMVAVAVSASIIADIIYIFYVIFHLKQRFIFKNFERGLFKGLFAYTVFIALNLIVDQINWNLDKFLLGRFRGTQSVAVYSVGYSLYNYYMMLSSAITGIFTPRIHTLVAETQNDVVLQKTRLTELFTKVGRLQFLLLGLIATGVVFFGQPFIYFWAGEGYESAYFVALLLIIPASIALIQNMGIEIQRAENKHQFRSIVYIIMAFCNLALSIFLCQTYGEIGAAIGTAISLVVANGLIMNIYYHKKCNIDILFFWKNIVRQALGLLIPIAFGVVIVSFIDLYNIWLFIAFVVIYILIYCLSMWFIGMNDYEKGLIKGVFAKIFKRKG